MMERAGYLQKTGAQAFDSEGVAHEMIEVSIRGTRYAIRTKNLAAAITGRVLVQIEDLTRNYAYYLGTTRGLGQVSASGKALNISLFHDGNYTVSLAALRSVMYGRERNAIVVKIPEHADFSRMRRVAQDQQQISAAV